MAASFGENSFKKNLFLLETTLFILTFFIVKLTAKPILFIHMKKQNKRNEKRFNNHAYSLFLLMAIFLKHLVTDSKYTKMTGLQDFY